MTSPAALSYDTYYHIFNRGNNRDPLFFEERNYAYFLRLYTKYIEPVADTFAYCLMPNHFHFLIRVKAEDEITASLGMGKPGDVSQRFSNLFNAYARTINQTYARTGSLFQHPFGRLALHEKHPLETVTLYIHFNPQKHGFVDDFRGWKYTSYASLLASSTTRLKRQETLDWFGGRESFRRAHESMDARSVKLLQDLEDLSEETSTP